MPNVVDFEKKKRDVEPVLPPFHENAYPTILYPDPPKKLACEVTQSKVLKEAKRIQQFDREFDELKTSLDYAENFDKKAHLLEYISLIVNLAEKTLKHVKGADKKRLVVAKICGELGVDEKLVCGLIDDLFSVWKKTISLYKRPPRFVRALARLFRCYQQ